MIMIQQWLRQQILYIPVNNVCNMSYEYKDGYKRKVKPRGFSLGLDTIERLQKYDEINWSKVVDKLLLKYLDQMEEMKEK